MQIAYRVVAGMLALFFPGAGAKMIPLHLLLLAWAVAAAWPGFLAWT